MNTEKFPVPILKKNKGEKIRVFPSFATTAVSRTGSDTWRRTQMSAWRSKDDLHSAF
jgi:hypothetical protein